MVKQREWLVISQNNFALQVLDPSENLYVIGGNTFDRTTRRFGVLSDIHIFQLRDAFYKYCSVTGAGLFSAVAGMCSTYHTGAQTLKHCHSHRHRKTKRERKRERKKERERERQISAVDVKCQGILCSEEVFASS